MPRLRWPTVPPASPRPERSLTAAAANAVPEEERAGALALLRVCGDLGLLTGSAGFGALAAAAGSDAAFGAASVLLVGTAARFRYLAPSK